MRQASGIGKEWYEQAEAFEQYVKGKTIEEVTQIAVTKTGVPKDADLTSSVTIKIGDFVEVLERAVENAQVVGSGNGDHIGVGIMTHMRGSKDAEDGEDGYCQAHSDYAAVTANADGMITGCILDSTRTNVTFDKTGSVTVEDIYDNTPTYKENAAIESEWYEQIAAYEAYVDGKTLEEVMKNAEDTAMGELRQVIEKACKFMKSE